MKVHKIGHCCLVIEDQGARILTDPGNFSTGQTEVTGLDAILLTHEHVDHVHIDSLKVVVENNQSASILTNTAVAKLLDKAQIPYTLLADGGAYRVGDLSVTAFEAPHAPIYPGIEVVLNTGFFIGENLFYPGDAFIDPGRPVDVLALPVAGPWMKTAECIDYALKINPRVCFPVHDAIVSAMQLYHGLPKRFIEPQGIQFVSLSAGDEAEF